MTDPEREQPTQEETAEALRETFDEVGSRRRALAGLGVGGVLAGIAGRFVGVGSGAPWAAVGAGDDSCAGLIIVVLSVTTCSIGDGTLTFLGRLSGGG